MALQMILCPETNKAAATDYMYIRETINRFYKLDNKTRITPVYMNSKSRYKSNEISKVIKRYISEFTIGETKVIYCVDTDNYEIDATQANELREVEEYCKDKEYEIVWFCHDVEEVYVGNRISANKKVAEAHDFRKKGKIQEISEASLSSKQKTKGHSNILLVLDKYLVRK